MKFLQLLILLFYPYFSFSQQQIDSTNIINHSYLILGQKIIKASDGKILYNDISQGTGFIVSKDNSFYLITAEHVVLECDNSCIRKRNKDRYDLVINEGTFISIDTALIKEGKNCKEVSPDLFIYKLREHTASIKFLDFEYLKLQEPIFNFTDIKVCGFPIAKSAKNGEYEFMPATSLNSASFSIIPSFRNNRNCIGVFNDLNDYKIKLNDCKVDSSFRGYSGSPVLAKSDRDNNWYFLGLLSSVNVEENVIFVVWKGEIIKAFGNVQNQ